MSDVVVQDGAVVSMGPTDRLVFRFDWDTEHLNDGVVIASQIAHVLGLRPAAEAISSLTRAAQVATVTTVEDHGLSTGALVTVGGATEAEYNISAPITVTGARTFTYAVTGSPPTPATGTPTCSQGLTVDASTLLSSAPYSSRSTQVRLTAQGRAFVGARYRVANTITTDESPAQTKTRSFTVVLETL